MNTAIAFATAIFTNISLSISQACRGTQYDHGTTLLLQKKDSLPPTSDVIDSATFSYMIPNAADVVVAFSCPPGRILHKTLYISISLITHFVYIIK